MPSPAPPPIDPALLNSSANPSNNGDLMVGDADTSSSDDDSRGNGRRGGDGPDDSYSPSQHQDEVDELEQNEEVGRASKSKAKMTVKGARRNKAPPEKAMRRQELAARLAGGNGKEPGHSGRKTTMSCENCGLRKMKCSRHPLCNNCRMRCEECVYLDLGPQNAARFASHHASIATNREEIARLNRLIRMLSTRYTTREATLAKAQEREPRPAPTLADVVLPPKPPPPPTTGGKAAKKTEEERSLSRHNSSPLEDAEALLALATPTVRDPSAPLRAARAPKLKAAPAAKAKEGGVAKAPLAQVVDEQQQPASTSGAAKEVDQAREKTPPPPEAGASTAVPPPSNLPSPEVIRPFGRPKLPRSGTTTDAVPSLRVSIPPIDANDRLPLPPSSRSSGHPSSARFPPMSARAPPLPPHYARSHHHSGEPYTPLDPSIPTAEHAYPHLSPFAFVPTPSQRVPPHLRGRHPSHSPYGSSPYGYSHSPFSSSGGPPLPPPPHFPHHLPSPQRLHRPDPYYFYPTLPSPLLSPRSVADLAATKRRMQFIQNQPHVLEQRRRLHEERYERALAVEKAKQAAAAARSSPEKQQQDGAERLDKGKRRADDLSDNDEREDEAKKAAEERQRDLARRAAESWAAFAAQDPSSSSNEAFAAVEPYKPMTREADPMLGGSSGGGGPNGLPSANPLSAGASSSFHHNSLSSRRASWLLVSPAGSPSALSPRFSRASARPSLTLDPTLPSFSSLRTPSAGPLSSLPSAGALLHGFGLPSAGATRPYISLSPMRSAHPLHSAVEEGLRQEGLRPFSSIRGVTGSPASQRGGGGFDERFEPMLERFEPMLERRASEAFALSGAGGMGAGDGWSRFEPVMEERRKEGGRASPSAEGADSSTVEGGSGEKDAADEQGDEEETGWETDGKSSVGRRSARSASRMSGRSKGDAEGEEEESGDETEDE